MASFKFEGHAGLARVLAGLLLDSPSADELLRQSHWVLPVPLSRERLRERGFNQSLLLARYLNHPGLLCDGLLRLRHTAAQASLPRHERLLNLTHAIACHPSYVSRFQHKRVLLVDDVMTTGSTLAACTQALQQVGVAEVDVLVLARADKDQGPQSEPDH